MKRLWKVFEETPSPVVDSYKLQLLTAQRSGEIHTMRWEDIGLKSRWWTTPAHISKNRKPHRVWLSDTALRVLKTQKKEATNSEYVFPGKWKQPYLTHDEARDYVDLTTKTNEGLSDAQKIKHWTPHDLRRTGASLMTAMQIPRLTVSKILNHAESGVTAIYDRYSYNAEKKEALDRWSKRLRVITSPLEAVKSRGAKKRPRDSAP